MAEFRLDRIRYNWRGTWSPGTRYIIDDVIFYNGKTYINNEVHIASQNFYTDFDANYFVLMSDGVTWNGDWQADTFYAVGSTVTNQGRVYQATSAHTGGTTFDSSENWQLVAIGKKFSGNWIPGNVYYPDMIVKFNGILYKCIQKHTATSDIINALNADILNWQVLVDSDSWRADWTPSITYRVNDIVRYGGTVYRCIVQHTSADTVETGLEEHQSNWEIIDQTTFYRSTFIIDVKYRLKDVVLLGQNLYECITPHYANLFEPENWRLFVPGLEFEGQWFDATEYQPGDIVRYGGYQYQSLTFNINTIPSTNTDDWQVLNQGTRWLGNYNEGLQGDSTIINYRTGDVVRLGGNIYVALKDNVDSEPEAIEGEWELILRADEWRNTWVDGEEYYFGDLVTYAGTLYRCIQRHDATFSESRPDIDQDVLESNYWEIAISGAEGNVLSTQGDLKTHDGGVDVRLAPGAFGQALRIGDSGLGYAYLDGSDKTYYVSTNGVDAEGYGLTSQAPFKTIRYASQYILADEANRSPATIFIKSGIYKEELPIIIPANVAVVGDELRSTNIQPRTEKIDESGSIVPDDNTNKNMFLMRNGSGLRNVTLEGLSGTLTEPNENFTRRPTAGAYVSLDPGTGPDDESTWIKTKSPYVQNVTTLGTGCVGMKIDGALHNGGNRSIVANDFTQILSDGIGYWATSGGRSELVSVFTYYCHIGYLADNGGILRGTNGNNSYGTYGSVAEGVDQDEIPITGVIDNRTKEAQTSEVYTDGNNILAVSYTNAGEHYTEASASFSGPGANQDVVYEEFRKKSLSKVRLLEPEDSSTVGGRGHTFLANYCQSGGEDFILLAQSTDLNPTDLEGLRLFIISGPGRGQYGYIYEYNNLTKKARIFRESDNTPGFDNVVVGKRSETELTSATQYNIESRPIIDEPEWTVGNPTSIRTDGIRPLVQGFVNDKFVTIARNNDTAKVSNDPLSGTWSNGDIVFNNLGFSAMTSGKMAIAVADDSPIIVHSTDGLVWDFNDISETITFDENAGFNGIALGERDGETAYLVGHKKAQFVKTTISEGETSTLGPQVFTEEEVTPAPEDADWVDIAYGGGVWIAVAGDGTIARKLAGVEGWTVTLPAVLSLGGTEAVTGICYGNNTFIITIENGDRVFVSSDSGNTWDDKDIINDSTLNTWHCAYSQGVFVLASNAGDILYSQHLNTWIPLAPASGTGLHSLIGGYDVNNNPIWILTGPNNNEDHIIQGGATPVLRTKQNSGQIVQFDIIDPGSGFQVTPEVIIDDPGQEVDVAYQTFIRSGVLAQPTFYNRGIQYVTAQFEITGDGYAEIYPIGNKIFLKDVERLPGPGDNLRIESIPETIFSVTKIVNQSGAGPYNLEINLIPNIGITESPEHEEAIEIRQRYSQIRLTGHDFLDIGSGNFEDTNYPELYTFGSSIVNETKQFNETDEYDGGRVFYTSTDQDGNFRVGELFSVEQARGTVTISAEFFQLDGLTELRLGAIRIGGTNAVINEFSTDSSFSAGANNVVPTQKAIKTYIENRFSGGGANVNTNTLVAGSVELTGQNIGSLGNLTVNVLANTTVTGNINGTLAAINYFNSGRINLDMVNG